MKRFAPVAAVFAALAYFFLPLAAQSSQQSSHPAGYHVARTVPLGGTGFWDYMAMDSAAGKLYISHGTHVIVFDVRREKVTGDIPDTPGVHGIAIADRLHRGFISDGGADRVTIFDLRDGHTLGTVAVGGRNPDCIIYDPATERVFTFNGRSGNSTAIDARTGKVVGTFDLGGRPEYAQPDGRGHIFNNLEDKSELIEIDARTLTVTHRWPLAPCENPSGMAIDAAHHRVFSGCHNGMMAVVNTDTGKVVATPAIGRGVDANRFDPGTGLAFSSNGDGTLTVVREDSPDRYTVVGNLATERGARTMALDLRTHTVYEVTAKFGPPAPGQRRPTVVPGSFHLLIIPK
ncbi:MAG TPA: PQQ-binding-like beta-propeller repeat protein [Terriglobales bacterium]|nr:PQQ-binding-like beta-propeller repeat protein [Terriglobales bacterium]